MLEILSAKRHLPEWALHPPCTICLSRRSSGSLPGCPFCSHSSMGRKIFRLGTFLMAGMPVALAGIIFAFGKNLLSIFGLGAESVAIEERFFRTIALFYIFNGLSMSIRGYPEGISDLLFSGAVGICSLGVRMACSYAFADLWGNMVVAYAEAFSWIFLVVVYAWRYYKKGKA